MNHKEKKTLLADRQHENARSHALAWERNVGRLRLVYRLSPLSINCHVCRRSLRYSGFPGRASEPDGDTPRALRISRAAVAQKHDMHAINAAL